MIIIDNLKQNNLLKFHIISFIFVCIVGTLLHFLYEWSNENVIVAAFSAVNESTWEHLKLVFFPMTFTTIIGYFFIGKNTLNYFCARMLGIISAISFITIFFYTYTGIIGTNFAFLDIGSFFIGTFIGEFISYKIMNINYKCNNKISIILLIFLFLCFVIFTYITPKINYFKDPINGTYGIANSK